MSFRPTMEVITTMSSSHSGDSGETPARLLAALRDSYRLLGQLLDSHRGYLLKIIGEEIDPRLNRRQGVSDIVQNALLNVIGKVHRDTEGLLAVGTEEDLRRWLRQIGLNALKQEIRDEGRDVRDFRNDEPNGEAVERPGCGPSPSSVVCGKERDELLLAAINALPEADRMLLRLREVHGWSYIALAELLDGEATDSGRVRMQRRLTQLRFELAEDDAIQGLY
jgi:RNA polymerase sigma factor (sigma-70 family)